MIKYAATLISASRNGDFMIKKHLYLKHLYLCGLIGTLFTCSILGGCKTETTNNDKTVGSETESQTDTNTTDSPDATTPDDSSSSSETTVSAKKQLVIDFMNKWTAKDFTGLYSMMSDSIKSTMTKNAFISSLSDPIRYSGNLVGNIAITSEKQDNTTLYTAIAEFENLTLHASFTATNKKIASYYMYTLDKKETLYPLDNNIVEKHFPLESDGYILNAVYTYVDDGAKHPTALLINGSGPSNADSMVGILTPFRDLAVALANQGINTLRIDKRTLLYGERFSETQDLDDEYFTDFGNALSYMKTEEHTDMDQIYLIGHSLGGQIAPAMAKADSDVDGLILLCSTPRKLITLMCEQLTLADPSNASLYKTQLNTILALKKSTCLGTYYLGASDYYWLSTNKLDSIADIKALKKPTLIVSGEKDLQLFDEDIAEFEKGTAGLSYVTMKKLPLMSHFFYDIDLSDQSNLYKPADIDADLVTSIVEFINNK